MSYQRRKVVRALERRGFRFVREGGNHTIYGGPAGRRTEVPRHKAVERGTVRLIARQAGIDREQFEREVS